MFARSRSASSADSKRRHGSLGARAAAGPIRAIAEPLRP
jgi:hypothetical protein